MPYGITTQQWILNLWIWMDCFDQCTQYFCFWNNQIIFDKNISCARMHQSSFTLIKFTSLIGFLWFLSWSSGCWKIVPMVDLAHLPLDKMATISQTTFSSAFSWIKSLVLLFEFHWIMVLRVQLTITQHFFYNGLALNKRQAIIWTNADPFHWCL